jgi:hypothetical protein
MTASSSEADAAGAAMTFPTNLDLARSRNFVSPEAPMPRRRMSRDWTLTQARSSRPAAAGGKAYE